MTHKKTYLGAGALVILLGAVVIVLIAGTSGDRAPDAVGADAGSPALAPTAALESLRSVEPRSDAEDAALTRARGSLTRGGSIPVEYRELTAARLVGTSEGLDLYAVGGPRSLCVVTAPHGSLRGMSVGCGRSPEATDGSRPVGGVGKTPDGRQRVYFLLPDGIDAVSARYADGTTRELPVTDNLISLTSEEPVDTLTWTDADGRQGEVSTRPE